MGPDTTKTNGVKRRKVTLQHPKKILYLPAHISLCAKNFAAPHMTAGGKARSKSGSDLNTTLQSLFEFCTHLHE